MEQVVELGDLVEDKITGFRGIVIARTEWLNKCVRIQVQPEDLSKEGKPVDSVAFDVEQLKIVKKAKVTVDKPKPTGGPKPAPTQRPDIRR